jgi:hypothetical protein
VRPVEDVGGLEADDSWSPWEAPPRQAQSAPPRTGVAHGRGDAPAPVRGGHPQGHEHDRSRNHEPRSWYGDRQEPDGWDDWSEQPRDLVRRTDGPAALGQRAPYYDTLDDRDRYRPSAGPGGQGGQGDRGGPGKQGSPEDPGFPDDPFLSGGPVLPRDEDDESELDLAPLPPERRTGARRVGPRRGVKGRLFAGALAVAVLVVLGVTVSEQVAADRSTSVSGAQAAGAPGGGTESGEALGVVEPSPLPPAWNLEGLTYKQRMGLVYDLSPKLQGPGSFTAVPGTDKAPREGDEFTYRVDIEDELGLDGDLFAKAVHKTLNDARSWAHDGLAFTRVPGDHAEKPDFVITLASPGTTAEWCAKSGLDTTIDNVSCDSASTSRVMINAYRWAQGAETYGDRRIHEYRQMLINHEVGHRLGYGHVECANDGGLAPVMQQQTKFLDHDGIHCRPNAWAYPNG